MPNVNMPGGLGLPLSALREVPVARPGAPHVTALVKDSGGVMGYQLSDGNILGKPEAVALARQGGIAGVGIAHRDGSEYLKSVPDNTQNNNLSSLPSITFE